MKQKQCVCVAACMSEPEISCLADMLVLAKRLRGKILTVYESCYMVAWMGIYCNFHGTCSCIGVYLRTYMQVYI